MSRRSFESLSSRAKKVIYISMDIILLIVKCYFLRKMNGFQRLSTFTYSFAMQKLYFYSFLEFYPEYKDI